MEIWSCKTHGIKLVIEGKTRTFATPPGSLMGCPRCMLFLLGGGTSGREALVGELKEGPVNDCNIVKERGE